jgi:hypothetical protein
MRLRSKIALAVFAAAAAPSASFALSEDPAPAPYLEMFKVGEADGPPNGMFVAAVILMGAGLAGCLGLPLLALALRAFGQSRMASRLLRTSFAFVFLAVAVLNLGRCATLLIDGTGPTTWTLVACGALITACAVLALARVLASPLPYPAPGCSRCGQEPSSDQERCSECGQEFASRLPVYPRSWMSLLMCASIASLGFASAVTTVWSRRPGTWRCVAVAEIASSEREATPRPGQPIEDPKARFAATVTASIHGSHLGNNGFDNQLVPAEGFAAEISWSPAPGAQGPMPTMRIESSVVDGVTTPDREQYDAAVAREAVRLVQQVSELDPLQRQASGEPFDAAVAQRVLVDFATMLRERLERGEAALIRAKTPEETLAARLRVKCSIRALIARTVELSPPWWVAGVCMLVGLVPFPLLLRRSNWRFNPGLERWILGEPRKE